MLFIHNRLIINIINISYEYQQGKACLAFSLYLIINWSNIHNSYIAMLRKPLVRAQN